MKNIHKAAVATALATMMLTGVNPVWAAGDTKTEQVVTKPDKPEKPAIPAGAISEQQAVKIVRDFAGEELLKTMGEPTVSFFHYHHDQRPMWHVSFYKHEEGSMAPSDSVYAMVDMKTGKLTSYQLQKKEWTGKVRPPQELAVAEAEKFLKAKRPDLVGKMKVSNWSGGGGSSHHDKDGNEISWWYRTVQFTEMVNGVPFVSNTVHINVDEYGHVVGMQDNMLLDSSNLPPIEMAIPASKATKIVSEQLKMNKLYSTIGYRGTETGEPVLEKRAVLGYQAGYSSAINAITGKPIDEYYPESIFHPKQEKLNVTGTGATYVAKSKEEAKQLVEKLLNIDLDGMTFDEQKNTNPYSKRDIWQLTWHSNEQDPKGSTPYYAGGVFDAQTGQILGLYSQRNNSETTEKPVLTIEEARKKAMDVLKTQLSKGEHEMFLLNELDRTVDTVRFPKWFDPTKVDTDFSNKDYRYSFEFTLGHQGVPVIDQRYSVEIDAFTGELAGLSISFDNVDLSKLPKNENTVDEATVKAKFLEKYPVKLSYFWPELYGQRPAEGQLVYQIDDSQWELDYIDALTGDLVKRDMQ